MIVPFGCPCTLRHPNLSSTSLPLPIIVQYYITYNCHPRLGGQVASIVYPKTSLSKKMGDACNGLCHMLAHHNMIHFCVLRCTAHQSLIIKHLPSLTQERISHDLLTKGGEHMTCRLTASSSHTRRPPPSYPTNLDTQPTPLSIP